MPILSKGEPKGILYLENNLAAGVFDQRRKEKPHAHCGTAGHFS